MALSGSPVQVLEGQDAVDAFVDHWQVDAHAAEYLRSLDEVTRGTVIAEFAPRDNTHDVAGKMYAFARSVMAAKGAGGAGAGEMSPELEQFALRWVLDQAAVAWLVALPQHISSILLREFEPKEDTQNVIGKMKSFARSIQNRLPGGLEHNQPVYAQQAPNGQMLNNLELRLAEFAQRWGIDDTALGLVRALPFEVQATVIEQFDPKGEVVNVNGKLCSFARSIAAAKAAGPGSSGRHGLGGDIMESFAAHWGLDEISKQLLREVPEDLRAVVYQQFDPDRGTRDVSNKLRMFVKGILSGSHGPGAAAGRGISPAHAAARRYSEAAAAAEGGGLFGGQGLPGGGGGAAAAPLLGEAAWAQGPCASSSPSSLDPAITDFVLRWNLDSSCVQILESLADDIRARVMSEFEPRDNTRNPSGKFIAFVKTVNSGQARPPPRTHLLTEPQAAMASAVELGEGEAQFLAKWGLQGNQTAVEVLSRLQPAVRERVMVEFMPGQDTNNVLGKLCGFATSVARAAAREVANGLPPLKAPGSSAPPPLLAGGHGHGHGGHGLGHGVARAPHGGGGGAPQPLDQFAARWRLDEGALAMLRGLDPDIQAAVMNDYQPHGHVRDPSGQFCAFARSVAARLRTGGGAGAGQKRPFGGGGVGGGFVGPPAGRPRWG